GRQSPDVAFGQGLGAGLSLGLLLPHAPAGAAGRTPPAPGAEVRLLRRPLRPMGADERRRPGRPPPAPGPVLVQALPGEDLCRAVYGGLLVVRSGGRPRPGPGPGGDPDPQGGAVAILGADEPPGLVRALP